MIKEYQLRLLPKDAYNEQSLKSFVAREYGFRLSDITAVSVLKRSIDARQRTIFVNIKAEVFVGEQPTAPVYTAVDYRDVSQKPQAIVVGAGPGGLFAALRLIENGIRPIVIERGKDVHQRKLDLASISRTQQVDTESNYCFGEGGAGAYSDGKLYTRSKKRGSTEKILNVFCQHGASTAILADAHPHIGTDRLPKVIENMRQTIIACGGEVHFQTRMTSLVVRNGKACGCIAEQTLGEGDTMSKHETAFDGPVILATGHSARDVYRYLAATGIAIEAKALAMGVRLEHPSLLIDQIQYHNRQGRGDYLPAAEYSFVTQVDGRGVYSFCMCPGGFVIPAATAPEQIVVNGMSPANRGTKWSNSGMVVEIHPEDVALGEEQLSDPLCMMHYQEQIEKLCWQQGNMRQTAPAQRMADFVNNRLSSDLPPSSYAPGLIASPIHFWMPPFIGKRLQEGFKTFGRQAHGFLTNDAIIIAAETRTSSPVRILRSPDSLQHVQIAGLFPCGEGAGYAGGIVSAGIDGERCADQLAAYLQTQ